MSWGFANAGPQATAGPELEEISTESLGFLSIAGETKLRLLPQPWPADSLPPSTASLFSIASNKGLIAAAGPDSLVIATTESVRQAYKSSDVQAENNIKPFTPQATIPIPRVSQVAFSADESCLVIAAEQGGGLAVYDVQAVLQGNKEPAFQMATNGIAVRALVPNPATDAAHFFAVVLANGQLSLANLKERQLVSGSNGTVFRESVSCVSWSAKGKQMVAGLEDGTAVQYDHQGNAKAQIPRPSQLEGQLPVTTIYWLANDDFLVIHTPVSGDAQDSVYHLIHREKASGNFTSQKFAVDPCPGFGLRHPANHFISRLRSFPPNLDDMLILSSTAATDIGVFTKSTAPLTSDNPIINTYTMTSMAKEENKASMPMSLGDDMGDTSPIGMVLDLSSKEKVQRPLPSEEMDESPGPLPALMLLNNEGILATWWIVYADSIRQGTVYPGLVSVSGSQPQATPALQSTPFSAAATSSPAPAPSQTPQTPAFGSSTFGKPAQPAFGQTSTPGFGGASGLGARSSPWGAPAAVNPSAPTGGNAFGKPAFGSTTPLGGASGNAAFGAAGGLGNKPSPWGAPAASPQASGPTVGQPPTPFGGGAASGTSGFAKFGATGGSAFAAPGAENKAPAASPFASFASDKPAVSPFASLAGSGENKPATSPFAAFGKSGDDKPATSPFAAFGKGGDDKPAASPFAGFGKPSDSKPATSPFAGLGGSGDNKPAASPFAAFGGGNDANKPSPFASFGQPSKPGMSGPSFGSTVTLGSTAAGSFGAPFTIGGTSSAWGTPALTQEASNQSKEAEMNDDETPPATQESSFGKPADKPSGFGGFAGFKLGSTFQADGSAKDDAPAAKSDGKSLFGNAFGSVLGEVEDVPATPIKKEPETDEPRLQDISTTPASPPKAAMPKSESAPLPPDFTAKKSTDDAPLPPDFTKSKPADDAPLPPDFTKASQAAADDAPLPPDFTTSKPKQSIEEDFPPIAGSPPVDLGARSSSDLSPPASSVADEAGEAEGPPEDEEGSWEDESAEDDEDEEGEEDEEDDEEVEEDEEDDEAEEEDEEEKTEPTKLGSAFGARLTFPTSPETSQQQGQAQPDSTTPAGLPKAPFFAPPSKVQESPRSPSPVRPTSTPAGRPPSRQPQQIAVPPAKPLQRSTSRPSTSAQLTKPAPPPEPESGDLSDDEDARIREILESDIEPTTELAEFIAHQDYVGAVSKPGIGGQIEKVFRDVNSMIDTLGLNARSLEAFVQGHEEGFNQEGRERSDLEDADDWTLIEVEDLGVVQKNIGQDLEDGRLQDVKGKIAELADVLKDTARLKAKAADMRKVVKERTDPQARASLRSAPLSPEAQAQQSELRASLTKVQKLLQDTESALSVLRADLASVPKASGAAAARKTPTVEAVMNTILKMTSMIEQKSGDVDVLEAQIRRLPHGVADLDLRSDDDVLASGLAGTRIRGSSPFATPSRPRTAQSGTPLGMSGMLGGRFRTPQERKGYGLDYSPASSALGRSVNGSARKKMSDVTAQEVRVYNDRVERRKRVLGALRETVEKKGTRIVKVGE